MRRIAVMNQKGGVGKTTTVANLGAALARLGRRVVVIDMDPQANLTLHLGVEPGGASGSTYTVLTGDAPLTGTLVATDHENLRLAPSHLDLAGAELELASTIGRETVLADAIDVWERSSIEAEGSEPADYVLIDCPPSLGLLSVNGLVAAREVIVALQTEFFALQGMTKLVEVVDLLKRRIQPELELTGILPCLYDSRLKLAREVLAEVRKYFPGRVFESKIRLNVKLAEAPSYGCSIFEYAAGSKGALDYMQLARELIGQEPESLFPSPEQGASDAELDLVSPPPEPLETAAADSDVVERDAEPEREAEQAPDAEPELEPHTIVPVPAPAAELATETVHVPVRVPEPEPEPDVAPRALAAAAASAPASEHEVEAAREPLVHVAARTPALVDLPARDSEVLDVEPEPETEPEIDVAEEPASPNGDAQLSVPRRSLPVRDYGYYLGEDRPEVCGQRGPRQRAPLPKSSRRS